MEKFECKECKKKFGSEESFNQHTNAKHKQSQKWSDRFKIEKKHIYFIIATFAVLGLGFWIYYSATSPGKYDGFAKCLTEKGFITAGTDWCSSCQDQKKLFGKSFKYINYKNCDFNKEWCSSSGIKSYPTWILPDKSEITGTQQLYSLSQASSGCNLK
jgi:hypothetical protein